MPLKSVSIYQEALDVKYSQMLYKNQPMLHKYDQHYQIQ